MRPFDYARLESADEIVAELNTATRPYAGGTDLLTRMKLDITFPERLIDIKAARLPSGIKKTDEGLSIGALTTLTEIEMSSLLRTNYPLLVEAAAQAATPQLRNRATFGGNLLQRPRCWYYRSSHVNCWLKGGEGCPAKEGRNEHHALFGGDPCYAVHPSDLAPGLMALDATVTLRGSNGERTLALAEFYALPEDSRRQETVVADDELVLSVDLPALAEGSGSTYLKAMDRKVWAFALVSVAAVLRLENGAIADARLVLGGVAPVPWRLKGVEGELLGQEPSEALFARAAEVALAAAEPLEHNAYKVPLAKSLLRRALSNLAGLERSV